MIDAVVILVVDRDGDPIAAAAVDQLQRWARRGTITPLWSVDATDVERAVLADPTGAHDVGLLRSIAGVARPRTARIVTVATSALPAEHAGVLAAAADRVVVDLRRYGPGGMPVVDVRVIAPDDLLESTELTRVLSPLAEQNLVLVPEDRACDSSGGVPVGRRDIGSYAGSVAVEVATAAGLWSGMSRAPVDGSRAGVIDHGDTGVVFARSMVRLAVGPALPVHEALAAGERLPVPRGTEAAPSQRQAALSYADQIVDRAHALHFRPVDPFTPDREAVGVRAVFHRLWRESRDYVRHLPARLRGGVHDDVAHVAGEAYTNALGAESTLEVVWAGKVADDVAAVPAIDVTAFRATLLDRLHEAEPPMFDQQLWSSMVVDVLAAVDGGAVSAGTTPLALGAQRLVVVEPTVIGPDPTLGLDATLATLDGEELSGGQATLLGRISARIRGELAKADDHMSGAIDTIESDLERLRNPRVGMAGFLAWTMSALLALITLTILLGLRVAEYLGIAEWSTTTRTVVGIVLAVAALGCGAICLGGALRDSTTRARRVWWACGATLASGLGLSWRLSTLRLGWFDLGPTQLANATQALTALSVLGIVIGVALHQGTSRGRAAARLAGAIALVYATLAVVGLFVRPTGWLATIAPDLLTRWAIRILVALVLLAVANFIAIIALRVRERLTIGTAQRRLRHSIAAAERAASEHARLAEALRQYHGTAIALDAMIWWPCGQPHEESSSPLPEDVADLSVLKLQTFHYEFSERGRFGVLARIRRNIAEPAWLQAQYNVAVEAFRPEFAFQTGRDLDAVATRRPESDPTIEEPGVGRGSIGVGPRWRFAVMLFDGQFDHDLRSSASRLALDDVLEQYFQRGDGMDVGDSAESDLSSFAGRLVAGQAPRLSADLFVRMSMPTADDPRTRLASRVWWPTSALSAPTTPAPVDVITVDHDGPTGMVLPFVRTDWSETFALHRLPMAAERTAVVEHIAEADTGRVLVM